MSRQPPNKDGRPGKGLGLKSSGRNRVKLLGGPYPDADTGFPEGGGGV